ncbi:MAG: hypothetical protein HGN29_16500 [Asgard group archaeon]|nr:hypothetical protein [Asgard group archaeon]
MCLDSNYIEVLKTLYSKLIETDIVWVIGGSLALKLQGLDVEPKDIDLFTDEEGAYEVEKLFAEYLVKNVSLSSKDNIRSHYGILNIHGIEVEIIGHIEFKDERNVWEVGRKLEDVINIIEYEEMKIPLMKLESQLMGYSKIGRKDKIELIDEWLKKQK